MSAPGGGLWGSPILIFPLGPESVLALFRHDMPIMLEPGSTLTHVETLELNRAILGNTDRLAFELPKSKLSMKLFVPDRPDPLRVETLRNSQGEESDVLRVSQPKRWENTADAPVRPVARWWPPAVPSASLPTEDEKAILRQFNTETHWL